MHASTQASRCPAAAHLCHACAWGAPDAAKQQGATTSRVQRVMLQQGNSNRWRSQTCSTPRHPHTGTGSVTGTTSLLCCAHSHLCVQASCWHTRRHNSAYACRQSCHTCCANNKHILAVPARRPVASKAGNGGMQCVTCVNSTPHQAANAVPALPPPAMHACNVQYVNVTSGTGTTHRCNTHGQEHIAACQTRQLRPPGSTC